MAKLDENILSGLDTIYDLINAMPKDQLISEKQTDLFLSQSKEPGDKFILIANAEIPFGVYTGEQESNYRSRIRHIFASVINTLILSQKQDEKTIKTALQLIYQTVIPVSSLDDKTDEELIANINKQLVETLKNSSSASFKIVEPPSSPSSIINLFSDQIFNTLVITGGISATFGGLGIAGAGAIITAMLIGMGLTMIATLGPVLALVALGFTLAITGAALATVGLYAQTFRVSNSEDIERIAYEEYELEQQVTTQFH